MLRVVVKLADSIVSLLVALVLLLSAVYATYCLWDNNQVYAVAENMQAELMSFKPKAAEAAGEPTLGFDELCAINADVCAWLTMDGTKIDHPVLHGSDNLEYINKDVYGHFALAGSIFLDSRNANNFSDRYNVLYGHHMEKSAMFGDLDKYLDEAFFKQYQTGDLLLPDASYSLQVIACLQTTASDERIFEPRTWKKKLDKMADYIETESLYFHPEVLEELRQSVNNKQPVKVIALTTCASGFTDARTIVLAKMNEYRQMEAGGAQP